MSEIDAATPDEAAMVTEEPDQPEPKPTETVDFWKQKNRELEKKLKENAAAKAELDKLKAANLSAEEKIAKEAAEAKAEAAQAKAEAMRWRIAARFGMSDEDAELFLTATDEETLIRQAQRFTELAPKAGKGNVVPGVGTSPTQLPTLQEQIRAAEQAGNKQLVMSLKAQQLADLAAKQR